MDPQGLSSAPLAAQCQLHVGRPFTAVCQRCGTYMCDVCTEGGRYYACAACRERGGVGTFPFTRDNYTFGGLLEFAWRTYKEHWLVLALAFLLSGIAFFSVSILPSLVSLLFRDSPIVVALFQVVMTAPQIILQGIATLGCMHIGLKAVRGEKPEVGDLFAVWKRLGTWFAQSLIVGALFMPLVLVGVGAMMLVMPNALGLGEGFGVAGIIAALVIWMVVFAAGAYLMMGVSFANLEIVAHPTVGAVAGLRNSWAIARGKRLEIFGLFMVTAALYLAGAIACLVGLLFTLGYALVLFAAFYLALRNGASDLNT